MIAHILTVAGHKVGVTSTDAVVIENIPIAKGDFSGPAGAAAVMKDTTIDYAVLEVARGGILRRGLGFQACDVGVFLNVTADHLGLGGIETIEDLARLKSTVTETVKEGGCAIFNADDPLVLDRASYTKGDTIFFSKDISHPALLENLTKGFVNVSIDQGQVVIQTPTTTFDVGDVSMIPITFSGQAVFNIENVMAATAAAYALGVNGEQIRAGLMSFNSSIASSPGRMNVVDIGDMKVIVDYGHNVGAVKATGDFLTNFMPGRKLRMVAGIGDRLTEDLIEYGETLADYADYVVITDPNHRNRPLGETPQLVRQGFLNKGFDPDHIEIVLHEKEATRRTLELAQSGDLIILQVENIDGVIQAVLDFRDQYYEAHGLTMNKEFIEKEN